MSTQSVRKVAILGATGSIGGSALEVIAASQGEICAWALTAHHSLESLCRLANRVHPRWVVATDVERAKQFDWCDLPEDTELAIGVDGLRRIASHDEVDVVLAAIVGRAGLEGAWAALEAGKTLALANKETLVVAGPLVRQLAAKTGAVILPVDSEHSAVFQALQCGKQREVRRVVLTASGGPFREHDRQQLEQVTVKEALNHPTWNMGAKITIDSATMMNKALEIIEARWLFDLDASQIEVVVHPQSMVHSMVEFIDGAVIAQLSPPDMKLPIQYAFTHPQRQSGPAARLDLSQAMTLTFEPPDEERFPALRLGRETAQAGGTAGAVLNAANEAAVEAFLGGQMRFVDIAASCGSVLESHPFETSPTLEQLLSLDRWARREVSKWIAS